MTGRSFIEAAARVGVRFYSGVPCSFLGPLISALEAGAAPYAPAANEGDAVAAAAGAYLGGAPALVFMQNSGLGNAVSPLTSLSYVFQTPMILLISLRGQTGLRDEPQHRLMGQITHGLLETMRVPYAELTDDPAHLAAALGTAAGYCRDVQRPYALLVPKGVFGGDAEPAVARPRLQRGAAQHAALPPSPADPPPRAAALARLIELTPPAGTVLIATTGHTGRELYSLADRDNHLYVVGSMGCASSLALGLALVRPDLRVVVIDGDGAAVMRMGNLAAIGAAGPTNLTHVVLDNGVHASTGGQATVAPVVDFAAAAAACGYAEAHRCDDLDQLHAGWDRPGPRLIHVPIQPHHAAGLPRPTITPPEVRDRLMRCLGVAPPWGEPGDGPARDAARQEDDGRPWLLLNPGPVNLSAGVRAALSRPDLCHREPEYADLQDRIRRGLLGVYGFDPANWAATLIGGSGTAAVEAMLISTVPTNGRVLIAANGVYGERMIEMAERHRLPHAAHRWPWEAPIDLDALASAWAVASGPTHLAVVHHETTVGRLNDLAQLAAWCDARGVRLLVDAVSSFGAEQIDPTWPIDACATTANKALYGAPGVAAVVVRREALRRAAPAPSVYLDLAAHTDAQDRGSTRFTPPVPALYALDAALGELASRGGWEPRHRRCLALSRRIAAGLEKLGVAPLLPDDQSAATLRAYELPAGLTYPALHARLKRDRLVSYAGQGPLADRVFRVAVMGEHDDELPDRVVSAVAAALADVGVRRPDPLGVLQ